MFPDRYLQIEAESRVMPRELHLKEYFNERHRVADGFSPKSPAVHGFS
jgi:hypothetical protein